MEKYVDKRYIKHENGKIIKFNKETLYLGNICIIRMELRLVNKTRYSENTICSISLLLTQVVLLIIKG
jgi:hypothetical protein